MNDNFITEKEKNEYLAYHTYEDVINNLNNGLLNIETFDFSAYVGQYSLICGGMVAFDKGIINFLNKWSNYENLFLLSEVTAENRRYTEVKCQMPYICTPHLLAKEMIIRGMDIPVISQMEKLIESKKYLKEAYWNLNARHPGLGAGYAENFVYYAYMYIQKLLDYLKPKVVILWNEFYAFHHIFRGICMEKAVSLKYMEFGCLPGTFCIEEEGQQGESLIAKYPKEFIKKKVYVNEFFRARNVINYLRISGLNRNVQPAVTMDILKLKYFNPRKKTVVLYGHNEYESGVFPYGENARNNHSPVFQSSVEAAIFLNKLAKKNNWNFIYKPHPTMVSLGHMYENELTDIDIVDDVNINSLIDFADLSVSLVSQVSYLSLIRNKPVIMLGYTQLKGKRCTYEAFNIENIEKNMKQALKYGCNFAQRLFFIKHCAQLLKYYLYDDLQHNSLPFGKKIAEINL